MCVFSANALDIQSWAGPGGFGRTVAAIGVDNALLGQLSAASTRPDLSWKVGSTQVSVKMSSTDLEKLQSSSHKSFAQFIISASFSFLDKSESEPALLFFLQ